MRMDQPWVGGGQRKEQMAPPLCVNTDWSSDTDGWAALSGRSPGGKSWLAASSPVASVPRVSQSPWLLVVPTDWEKGVCAEKSTKQRTLGHHLGWGFFFFFFCVIREMVLRNTVGLAGTKQAGLVILEVRVNLLIFKSWLHLGSVKP